ncbi:MAG: glycosyltransferase family 2 protein [Acidobacteriota bacterium]
MKDKIVLLTHPIDQGDILKDYIQWHLDLGVDLILAQDSNSSDNTHEVLDDFSRRGHLRWFPIPVKNFLHYRPTETLAQIARERYYADWVILTDVDEFLCPLGDDLRTVLQRARTENISAIRVPCFNMTGPLMTKKRATRTQILRIDRAVPTTFEQLVSGDLPSPFIFVQHPPKTIVRADALDEYAPGGHDVKTTWGNISESSEFRILHFPMRGFDKFEQKVRNAIAFFQANDHYEDWWAWHWRRWIRFYEAGRLREEYENQFISAARAEELISQGICSIDRTIADWIDNKNKSVIYRLNNWGPMARLRRSLV